MLKDPTTSEPQSWLCIPIGCEGVSDNLRFYAYSVEGPIPAARRSAGDFASPCLWVWCIVADREYRVLRKVFFVGYMATRLFVSDLAGVGVWRVLDARLEAISATF